MATRRVVFHRQPVVFLAAAGIELHFTSKILGEGRTKAIGNVPKTRTTA